MQKIAFRFSFCFLGILSLICYNILLALIYTWQEAFYKMKAPLSVFSKPLAWLDSHFYHIGYTHPGVTFYQDNRYAWVLIITLFFVSVLATFIWSLSDHKRMNYNKLHYWFRIYIVYHVCLAMIFYAAIKIIPIQMPYPNVEALLKPIGESDRFWLLWYLIGISPAYSVFMGCLELTGALLVLNRRTRIFGLLFLTTILINVVCLNIFFNVPVKMGAIQLLIMTLFLLVPYLPKLFRIFYHHEAVSLKEKGFSFSTPWKKYLLVSLFIGLPVLIAFKRFSESIKTYKTYVQNRKQEKLYNVTAFIIEKDSLPPLITDTVRWSRIAFTDYPGEKNYALAYNMKNEPEHYYYTWDTLNKCIHLINTDTIKNVVFNYSELNKDVIKLHGELKRKNVSIMLTKINIDSMNINLKNTTWVRQF